MIIDTNMYWLPESLFEDEQQCDSFLSEIPKNARMNGYSIEKEGKKQIVIEKPIGYQNLNYVQGEYSLSTQLKDMDSAGVDKAIMKIPGAHEWMSLATCKVFNDGMHTHAQASNGRMIPLAVLPPIATKECNEEYQRCLSLGFHGVQLCAHYGDRYLDNESFAPFFEMLNETETTVYIHHVPVPVQYDNLYEYNNLRRSYGRCIDQTTAICREIFSGFFKKYDKLTFVHSMMGGGIFAIANMLFPTKEKTDVQRFIADEQLKEMFQNHVYFEMSHAQPWGKDVLECAIKILGADHILFGTSYPVRQEWLTQGVAFINQLDITEDEKKQILGGNASKLYHIKENDKKTDL